MACGGWLAIDNAWCRVAAAPEAPATARFPWPDHINQITDTDFNRAGQLGDEVLAPLDLLRFGAQRRKTGVDVLDGGVELGQRRRCSRHRKYIGPRRQPDNRTAQREVAREDRVTTELPSALSMNLMPLVRVPLSRLVPSKVALATAWAT